jgi:hypothetical protein
MSEDPVTSIPLPPGVSPEPTPCPAEVHHWTGGSGSCPTCHNAGRLLSVRVVVDELPTVPQWLSSMTGEWTDLYRPLDGAIHADRLRERSLCDGDTVTVAEAGGCSECEGDGLMEEMGAVKPCDACEGSGLGRPLPRWSGTVRVLPIVHTGEESAVRTVEVDDDGSVWLVEPQRYPEVVSYVDGPHPLRMKYISTTPPKEVSQAAWEAFCDAEGEALELEQRNVTAEPWADDARPGRYLLVIEDMTEEER